MIAAFSIAPVASFTLTALTSPIRAALPLNQGHIAQVRLANLGPNIAFVRFGDNTVDVTANDGMAVPAGAIEVFSVPPATTHIIGMVEAGSAKLNLTAGTGM